MKVKQVLVKLIPKRIWQQLGLAFALMLAILLFFLGFLLIKTSRTAVRDSVLRDYEEIAYGAAREIINFIDEPKNLLINTAGMLGTLPREDIEVQKVLVYQLITDYPALFERVALTELNGQESVSSEWERDLKDHSQDKIFQDILITQKPGLSKVYFSNEHFPYITMAVPIKRLNKMSGVLMAEVKLSSIWNTVAEIKLEQGQIFLVDEAGYALVHNEEKEVYRGNNLKQSRAVQAVLQGKVGSIEEDLPEQEQWLSAYAPLTPLGWGLVIRQPVKTAYAFSFRMQQTAFIIIAVAIGMTILLSLAIARWIARPIINLTKVTEKVAAGDLDQSIKFERSDEVGRLLASFNEMTRRLKKAKGLERLSDIGVATSKIAHELRNPLVALKTFMQLLPRRYKDEKFIAQFQETVPREMVRLEKMLNTLTSFSVEPRLRLNEYDVVSLIRDSLELFGEQMAQQKVSVSTIFEPANINLSVDSDRIKQVFINLLRNALEAMPQGGNLNINSKICLDGQMLKGNHHPASFPSQREVVEIKITDTGCGMNQAVLKEVFEPFYTSKKSGLGLGLAICKEIVEQHQGTIEVESQKDKGAIFTVKLPVRS